MAEILDPLGLGFPVEAKKGVAVPALVPNFLAEHGNCRLRGHSLRYHGCKLASISLESVKAMASASSFLIDSTFIL